MEAQRDDWKRRESLGSALLQIGAVGALLSFAVYFAWQRGTDREAATVAIEKARGLLRQDSVTDLRAALQAVQPAQSSKVRGADAHAVAARAHAELAVVHQTSEALDAARRHLEAAAGSEVEEVQAAQALLLLAEGKADAAVSALEPQTQRGVRRMDLEYVLARAHLAAGREELAFKTLERAAEVAAGEPRIHALRGDLLLDRGEAEQAVASYRRALAANSRHPGARLGVVLALGRKSLDGAAVDATLAALEAEGVLAAPLKRRALEHRPPAAIAVESAP